ncbi:MAG TPA: PKD domain-containing protein, partial [Planctomycetota bacterium]|nr:PKD domain-containing protein [Planctomycetota bacterium]
MRRASFAALAYVACAASLAMGQDAEPDFTGDPLTGCAGLSVSFTNTTTEGPVLFHTWDFGDGEVAVEENPVHVYEQPGRYTVTLTIMRLDGTLVPETKEDYIEVLDPPVAAFDASPKSGCAPLTVDFSDESSGSGIDSFTWDFGDGESSDDDNPRHVYESPGTYTVSLTVRNGCTSSTEQKPAFITVGAGVVADFSANPTSGCAPLAVDFSDQSTGNDITSWSWDFGDGSTSGEEDPRHVYQSPGSYTVSLTVGNACGSDTEARPAIITVIGSVTAAFTADPTAGCAPLTVDFSDQSQGSGINSWSWDFGDGSTSSAKNPRHVYQSPGSYQVRLTAANDCASSTETKPAFITAQAAVNADFQAAPTSGCASLTVDFSDLSTGEGITSWSWNFGDGNTSSDRNPRHVYQDPGSYTVTLIARSPCGSSTERKPAFITVEAGVSAAFVASPASGCSPLAVDFSDRSTGEDITSWSWDFGNGNTSSDRNPRHVYQSPGSYTVSLTVRNACGSDTETRPAFITAKGGVTAAFTASLTSGCAPLVVDFKDRTTGDSPRSWSWDFGDGETSSTRNPRHTFDAPGTYTVKLTVRGDCGEDTRTETNFIQVGTIGVADFVGSTTSGCPPLTVDFADRSTGVFTSWRWTFGDGDVSTEQNPRHIYTEPGTYTVRLTAQGECGPSVKTLTGFITVSTRATADFRTVTPSGCVPLEVAFQDRSSGGGIVAWSWSFGDGGTSSEQNPRHNYSTAGTFTVSLTVTDECGQDTETRANAVRVLERPAAPSRLEHTSSAFLGDILSLKWPEAARAEVYFVEAMTPSRPDWFEVCSVEEDSGLREFTCSHVLDEIGPWRFRVSAENDCGGSDPTAGPELEVLPPAIFADWPLDNCVATDIENGNNGRFTGIVACVIDRFGKARSALQFKGTGFVDGQSLPPWDENFAISLWTQPREGASGPTSGARTIFEVFPGGALATPLTITWDEENRTISARHGPDEGAPRTGDVSFDWHHVLVTRSGGSLTLYVDGVPAPSVADEQGLGIGFAMGSSQGGASPFEGDLDHVLYESRARDASGVIDQILATASTVHLVPGSDSGKLSLQPGESEDILGFEVRAGQPANQAGFRLAGVRLLLEDLAPDAGETPAEAFDFLDTVTLFSKSRCDGSDFTRTEVGTLELVPVSSSEAVLELDPVGAAGVPLTALASTCFLVEARIRPRALTRNRTLRLGIKSPDDLRVLDGPRNSAFVAGARRVEGFAALGKEVHVLNEPPRLSVTLELSSDTVEARSPVGNAPLHTVALRAGSSEGVRLERIVYRSVKGTTLAGVSDAVLFVETGGAQFRAGEGTVDPEKGEVLFAGLSVEIPADSIARLTLQADIQTVAAEEESEAAAITPPPLTLPRLPAPSPAAATLGAALLAASALLLAAFRGARRVPRVSAALSAWVLTSTLLLAGCGPALIGGAVGIALLSGGGGGG